MFRIILADKVTSLTAAQAISSALYVREKTGEGQHIKLSMLETMLSFFWPEGMTGLTYGEMEFDVTTLQGTQDLIYETQDRYITAGAISDKEWTGMCRALEREDLIDDPRFKTAGDRFVNVEERKKITAEEIKKWSSSEILERLESEDVPSAPLLTRMELMDHEQIIANESITKIHHDGFGEVRQARPAARFDKTPSEIAGPAPKLGEHGPRLLEELGYDSETIESLIVKGHVNIGH
jgi:crotonobetainyl-CoA:carnitine CoA-transferase CaiB-like acyl-CoA transferase